MKVSWSRTALAQLRAAHAYIAQDNPRAANEFVQAATALSGLLGEYPGMGVATDEPGIIMFPLVRYRYLIFYKVLPHQEVRIVRVRHASRKRIT
jgi:toxin ParE1/3/4